MYYCPKCQSLCEDKTECPFCGNRRLREPEDTDPVLLLTADESKAEMIQAAFQTEQLPCEERVQELGGLPSVLIGSGAYTNKNIFIPYGELERAREILAGIGLAKDENHIQESDETLPDDEDGKTSMSPVKRTVVRILSVILFILAVWGVVTVSDYAANALKGLFSNF